MDHQQPHSVRSFDAEIKALNALIAQMAKACSRQLNAMKKALIDHDAALAEHVISDDEKINRLDREIEETTVVILAKRQPMAQDLRHILTAMKMGHEMERIGDYAANVARRVQYLSPNAFTGPEKMLVEMAETAVRMVDLAVGSFLDFDVDTALSVWRMDDQIDAVYGSVMMMVQDEMSSDKDTIAEGNQINYMARCLERTGDHITNMAEQIYYMATGKVFPGE